MDDACFYHAKPTSLSQLERGRVKLGRSQAYGATRGIALLPRDLIRDLIWAKNNPAGLRAPVQNLNPCH